MSSAPSISSAGTRRNIRVLEGYLAFLRTGDDDVRVFAQDSVADFNFPAWRVQAGGAPAILRIRRQAGQTWAVHLGAYRTTPDGFVAEVDYLVEEAGGPTRYRTLSLAVVTDDRISHLVHYCTGPWDEATVRRHAEAGVMLPGDRHLGWG